MQKDKTATAISTIGSVTKSKSPPKFNTPTGIYQYLKSIKEDHSF